MRTIIPILRDTVRPNPDYGKEATCVPGRKTCWFELHDAPIGWVGKGLKINIPFTGFTDGVTFASESLEMDVQAGTLNARCVSLNSQLFEIFMEAEVPENILKYMTWGAQRETISIPFAPQPPFLYEHDPEIPVTCTECGESTSVGKIPEVDFTDSDGDWRCADQCPHCGALYSFDYEFEKL